MLPELALVLSERIVQKFRIYFQKSPKVIFVFLRYNLRGYCLVSRFNIKKERIGERFVMRISSDIQGANEAYLEKAYLAHDKGIGTGINEVRKGCSIIAIGAYELQKMAELNRPTIGIGKIKEQLEAGIYSVNGKLVAKSIINLFD